MSPTMSALHLLQYTCQGSVSEMRMPDRVFRSINCPHVWHSNVWSPCSLPSCSRPIQPGAPTNAPAPERLNRNQASPQSEQPIMNKPEADLVGTTPFFVRTYASAGAVVANVALPPHREHASLSKSSSAFGSNPVQAVQQRRKMSQWNMDTDLVHVGQTGTACVTLA